MTACSESPSQPSVRRGTGRRATCRWLLLFGVVTCLVVPPTPAAADTGRWVWPLTPRPAVVRGFEPPDQPWGSGHRGVDLSASPGDQVLAAGDGVVSYAGLLAGRGVVAVRHGALRTTYEPLDVTVRRGERVRSGEPLGRLTTTGGHCRPRACLHWGLRRGTAYLDPLSLVGAGRPRLLPTDEGPTTAGTTGAEPRDAPPRAAERHLAAGDRPSARPGLPRGREDDRPAPPSAAAEPSEGATGKRSTDASPATKDGSSAPEATRDRSAYDERRGAHDRLDPPAGEGTDVADGHGGSAALAVFGALVGLIVGGVTVALRRGGATSTAPSDPSQRPDPPPHAPAPSAAGVLPFPTRPRPPSRVVDQRQRDAAHVIDLVGRRRGRPAA